MGVDFSKRTAEQAIEDLMKRKRNEHIHFEELKASQEKSTSQKWGPGFFNRFLNNRKAAEAAPMPPTPGKGNRGE